MKQRGFASIFFDNPLYISYEITYFFVDFSVSSSYFLHTFLFSFLLLKSCISYNALRHMRWYYLCGISSNHQIFSIFISLSLLIISLVDFSIKFLYLFTIKLQYIFRNWQVEQKAGGRGRGREWATLGVHPLSWLLSKQSIRKGALCKCAAHLF